MNISKMLSKELIIYRFKLNRLLKNCKDINTLNNYIVIFNKEAQKVKEKLRGCKK